ncbi:MAG: exodeoxyribonuclease VII small subunit [Verrucomicrobiota bacterium]|nr:exodeoxyribonuclease VII small subunit [Verrucomicrobiota bacterium]MDG1891578.1 exodeoxyribonuclease VII small subunit [Verrucomicrobiota bacterium]
MARKMMDGGKVVYYLESVAKTVKTKEKTDIQEDTLSFEEALKQLESIVDEMENKTLPLEKLLTCHEKGVRLQAVCQKKLEQAEQRIQQLEKNVDDKFRLKPLTLGEESQ